MSNIYKMTTSFIKFASALDKVKNQHKYNIYVSMLDEEELECLKYVQRLRKYTNRQLLVASPTDTDASKPEKKKRGRKKKVGATMLLCRIRPPPKKSRIPLHPPFLSHDKGARKSVLVYFELLAQHIVSAVVFFDRVCLFLLLSHILAPQMVHCHCFNPVCAVLFSLGFSVFSSIMSMLYIYVSRIIYPQQ
ncbi:MAG: hypothetical protein ACKPKO_09015, partial [Candidatus Fonsibacter sp.]